MIAVPINTSFIRDGRALGLDIQMSFRLSCVSVYVRYFFICVLTLERSHIIFIMGLMNICSYRR